MPIRLIEEILGITEDLRTHSQLINQSSAIPEDLTTSIVLGHSRRRLIAYLTLE
jgi:hypothetical protein